VEAARIAWRPLGRLLVEQGLLTDDELERALARQQETGKRLGETIVELGFVSGPDLASALATQYGIELTMETGFGTGLRALIQRRHENDRGIAGPPTLSIVEIPQPEAEDSLHADESDQLPEVEGAGEALLLRQLEEQWARLAAAEESLAESEREIAALRRERDRRRQQAVRLVQRVRARDKKLEEPHEDLGRLARMAEQQLKEIERLRGDVEGCDAEIERLRSANDHLRAQAGRFATRLRRRPATPDQPETATPMPSSHLVFVQLGGGYELVEKDGPPPPLHTLLELPQFAEDEFVVTRLGHSPLPADERACIFVQRV
jgi:DNA repair exonuclease SbcCD ATPase subunit